MCKMERGGRSLEYALAVAVLVLSFAVSLGMFAAFGAHNLDADMSSEMLLARLQNEEGTLLSRSWYYSTELRVVSPVPLFQLGLLLFPEDWQAARTVATGIMLAGIVASFLYFARKARMGASGVLMAAILTMPFSQVYAYVGFQNGGYSVYLMLVFVLLGLVLGMEQSRRRPARLAVIALLSLWGGMGGIRMMLFLALPLAGACALELFDALRREERIAHALRGGLSPRLSAAAVIFAATAAGYAFNEKVLTRLYDYDHYSGIALSMPSSDVVFAQLTGIAEFFGCRASSRLFSARGVASLLGFAMMGLCALALCVLLRRRREGRLSTENGMLLVFTVFSVALGMMVNVLTGNYFVRYYLPGLLMLVVMLLLAWQGTSCKNRMLRAAVPLAIAAVFALEAGICLRQDQRMGEAPYEKAAGWLLQNGYTQGFATFWNAATLTEATNGAITVYTMPDPYWQDDYKSLTMLRFLQEKANVERAESGALEGEVFVLLTDEELVQGVPYADDGRLACRTEAGSIYLYEDDEALRSAANAKQ
ncbi:MAG: hypothetical protein PUH70_03190 [Clostridiales bacterium]|nr:hypothetical protein [Clostridiales bacterium]MDY5513992.1 hypothetical protein [Candidatus Ventricola sp.]